MFVHRTVPDQPHLQFDYHQTAVWPKHVRPISIPNSSSYNNGPNRTYKDKVTSVAKIGRVDAGTTDRLYVGKFVGVWYCAKPPQFADPDGIYRPVYIYMEIREFRGEVKGNSCSLPARTGVLNRLIDQGGLFRNRSPRERNLRFLSLEPFLPFSALPVSTEDHPRRILLQQPSLSLRICSLPSPCI